MINPMLKLHQQIGGMLTSLEAIKSSVDKSEAGRQRLHEKIDTIGRDIHDIKMTVADNTRRIDGMETHVDDWRRVKQRGVGIILLIGAGITGLATLGKAAIDYLKLGG